MASAPLRFCRSGIFFLSLLIACGAAHAKPPQRVLPRALLISDIHFDPMHDPAKLKLLAAAPVSGWDAILGAPDSPTQAADFAALQTACKASSAGVDTPYALLASAMQEIHTQAAGVRFVLLSGDLLVHEMDCRWATLMGPTPPAAFTGFAAKTIAYQMLKLRQALPGVPVYLALGNNDSDCGHYHLDAHGPFLAATAKSVESGLGGIPLSATEKAALLQGGYYSVRMAAPMQATRLIVLNDVTAVADFENCKDQPDTVMDAKQMAWLAKELAAARAAHERVWVMGHIPPGVNTYSTLRKLGAGLCTPGAVPAEFLGSDALLGLLEKNADQIQLLVFGHTHADEMRLYGGKLPTKVVPSITTVDGNYPTITIATIDPAAATLVDYTVYLAADKVGTSWSREYSYAESFGEKAFTADALSGLMQDFRSGADDAKSHAYLQHYAAGESAPAQAKQAWPVMVCGMTAADGAAFKSCACGGK